MSVRARLLFFCRYETTVDFSMIRALAQSGDSSDSGDNESDSTLALVEEGRAKGHRRRRQRRHSMMRHAIKTRGKQLAGGHVSSNAAEDDKWGNVDDHTDDGDIQLPSMSIFELSWRVRELEQQLNRREKDRGGERERDRGDRERERSDSDSNSDSESERGSGSGKGKPHTQDETTAPVKSSILEPAADVGLGIGQLVLPAAQHVPTPGQHVQPAAQHVPTPGQHVQPAGQHMSPAAQHVPPFPPSVESVDKNWMRAYLYLSPRYMPASAPPNDTNGDGFRGEGYRAESDVIPLPMLSDQLGRTAQ